MVRYRESDFVLRTVEFFPDYFFLFGFSRPNFLKSRGRARRSQPKSISGKASAQFQMFTTLPKSYNENQFLAHIVVSLQACHSDPLEIYIQNLLKKNSMVRNGESHSLFRTVVFFPPDYIFFYVNFSEETPASEFTQGCSRFRLADAGDPHDLCFLARCSGGWWVDCGTMNPSPPTDRQYIDFDMFFICKAGTYAAGTRYLRGQY